MVVGVWWSWVVMDVEERDCDDIIAGLLLVLVLGIVKSKCQN